MQLAIREMKHSADSDLVSTSLQSFFRQSVDSVNQSSLPRIADLFAGAGGFSLGFQLAGGDVTAAIEIDEWACETLAHNHNHTKVHCEDICSMTDDALELALSGADVIIGGPPCQGFSVANMKAGDPKDPRNSLFREFIRAAAIVKPRAILMENVPGLLKRRTADGERVIDVITREFRRLGFISYVAILQAMDYGVPQIRPRLFVLGLRRPTNHPFPVPTHGNSEDTSLSSLFSSGAPSRRFLTVWDAISEPIQEV